MALCCVLTASAAPKPAADYVASVTWATSEHRMGGFSGLEIWDNGHAFTTISDRGGLITGRFQRRAGKITGISASPPAAITSISGQRLVGEWADSEGLARRPDGRLYISFEGQHRVLGYDRLDMALHVPNSTAISAIPNSNSGLEALAIDTTGRLYAIPERSGRLTRPFPVWRLDGDRWDQVFTLPREGGFLVVGADFGPRGRLYILERAFTGFGFRSRVRRFTMDNDRITAEETLLETPVLRHDNLEGLAVWRDTDGATRLTMISDDNFRSIQRTEFVEYKLQD